MLAEIGIALGVLALQTLDGHEMVLSNYGERRGTVLVYLSARCPVTEAAMEAVTTTYERFRLKEILFVGLFASEDESSEEIRAFCQGNGVCFPVYRDPGGAIAKRLGARVTPEAFLVDKDGVLQYRGSFHDADAAKELAQAITGLIKGRPIDQPTHPADGTPLSEALPPRPVEDRYGTPAFSSELIFEQIPGAPAHHCSTIAECANGGLICVWYGGSYESADDQVLFLSRKKKGERAWSAPEVVVKGPPLHPPGNAVVFRIGPERIGLLWGRMDAHRPIRRGAGWGECQLMIRYSDDHGYTWTDDVELEGFFGCLPRNAPLTLHSGVFAIPLSGHTEERHGSFLLMTPDQGAVWRTSTAIPAGSQPTVIQRDDGSLLALMRARPKILKSESHDEGETWTPPEKTELNCPSAGIAMRRLRNGHLVLVHNDSSISRTPLSIRRSTDEGKTWEKPLELECNFGEYSYPCVIQTADGRIHVTYTFRRYSIKHAEFNEDWLTHFDRPN